MKKIQNFLAFFLILAIIILTVVSIFGVWDIFDGDVVMKSFETLGLLAFVSAIIIAASHAMDSKSQDSMTPVNLPNPAFKSIRRFTVGVLIASSAILAFLGILSIWDIISDQSVLNKSLGSLAILAFSSLVIIVVCREREGGDSKKTVVITKSEQI